MKNKGIIWRDHFIELVIVVIGIYIAFSLNNLDQNRKQRSVKNNYLAQISKDLAKDSLRLTYSIKYNTIKTKKLERGLELIRSNASVDSVFTYIIEIGNYDFFTPDNFTLNSMLQSGDFKLIERESTKIELLRLQKMYEFIDQMQANLLQALDENYFPMLLSNMDWTVYRPVVPEFFFGLEIKNYCAFTLNETSQHIDTYKRTQKQISKVIQLIDAELNESP